LVASADLLAWRYPVNDAIKAWPIETQLCLINQSKEKYKYFLDNTLKIHKNLALPEQKNKI
jgi:hypothetical protein